MKRAEAIKILLHCGAENYCHHYIRTENCYGCNRREALDMATEALSQPTCEKCTSPSADRPKGEWIEVCDTSRICSITRLQCSKCGEEWLPEYTSRFNYCPNCGADMRDNQNENRD